MFGKYICPRTACKKGISWNKFNKCIFCAVRYCGGIFLNNFNLFTYIYKGTFLPIFLPTKGNMWGHGFASSCIGHGVAVTVNYLIGKLETEYRPELPLGRLLLRWLWKLAQLVERFLLGCRQCLHDSCLASQLNFIYDLAVPYIGCIGFWTSQSKYISTIQ